MARIGPRSLGQIGGIHRYAQELFEERTTGKVQTPFGVYGLTYQETLRLQMQPCEICGRPATRDEVNNIDHDHASGMVRGTLCWGCNIALGHFVEDRTRMLAAVKYLSRWAEKRDADAKEH
jgi:hypothetical protein